MIKLKVSDYFFDYDFSWAVDCSKCEFKKDNDDRIYAVFLRYDYREWMNNQNIQYYIEYTKTKIKKSSGIKYMEYYLIFENKQDAMLFKLTWYDNESI